MLIGKDTNSRHHCHAVKLVDDAVTVWYFALESPGKDFVAYFGRPERIQRNLIVSDLGERTSYVQTEKSGQCATKGMTCNEYARFCRRCFG